MKIVNDIKGINPGSIHQIPRDNKDASFSEALGLAMGKGAPSTSKVNPPQGINHTLGPGLSPQWFQINGLLDSLNEYGRALGDNSRTLKDIEPLVTEMENRAQDLDQYLQRVEDSPLHNLAQQALTQVKVESIKFRRGDYV